MILLDSCAILNILLGETGASTLSDFLDSEQSKGNEVALLSLVLLEVSSAIAVRFKEERLADGELPDYLDRLKPFQNYLIYDDLTPDIIAHSANIKAIHSASMVDCCLISNAIRRNAEIATCDPEILNYSKQNAKHRRITEQFKTIQWK